MLEIINGGVFYKGKEVDKFTLYWLIKTNEMYNIVPQFDLEDCVYVEGEGDREFIVKAITIICDADGTRITYDLDGMEEIKECDLIGWDEYMKAMED